MNFVEAHNEFEGRDYLTKSRDEIFASDPDIQPS
jgi:hypothetical protein